MHALRIESPRVYPEYDPTTTRGVALSMHMQLEWACEERNEAGRGACKLREGAQLTGFTDGYPPNVWSRSWQVGMGGHKRGIAQQNAQKYDSVGDPMPKWGQRDRFQDYAMQVRDRAYFLKEKKRESDS